MFVVLVAYDFFALVAFEQIVRLVKSSRYQQFYGDDPFNPILTGYASARKTKEQPEVHPMFIFVKPKINGNVHPKWWQMANDSDEMELIKDTGKYFQRQELLPDVMLHNAVNISYMKNQRF